MNRSIRWIMFAVVLLAVAGYAQNPNARKARIGVFDLTVLNGNDAFGRQANSLLANKTGEAGHYEVLDQAAMARGFREIDRDFPRNCADPECIIAVGKSLQLDRAVFGAIEKQSNAYGIELTLLDIMTKQVIESVELQSEAGIELESVIHSALLKLHGREDESLNISFSRYYGPEVHNEKEAIIVTAATIGAGLIWALGNGAFEREGGDLSYSDKLSGIPSRSYTIPHFARATALANSYVAASDDAYGVFYNPAGLSWIPNAEGAVGYQYRWDMSNFVASYANKATREIGFGAGFLYNGQGEDLSDEARYSEATFVTAGSYKFNRTFSFMRPFSVGVAMKMFTSRGDAVDPGPDDQSVRSFGLGFDLGLRAEISDQIVYGLLFRDAPSFSFEYNAARKVSYTENNPTTLEMGGTFKAGYLTMLFAGGQIPLYRDQNWKISGGIEQTFFRVLRGRIGLGKTILEDRNTPWIFTAGIGIDITTEGLFGKYLLFDGSYEYNQLSFLSNVINCSFRFGF